MQLDELIDRFISHLLLEKGYSEATAEAYSTDLLAWLEATGAESPEDLTQESVLSALSEWTGDYARTTLSRRVSALRSFDEFLQREELGGGFAPEDLKIALPDDLPETLTEEEVEQLLEAALGDSDELGVRNRAMLELLYSSGLRASELVALEFDDLNMREQVLFVRSGKGGKDRVVPVGDAALEWLRRYLAEVREGMPDSGLHGEIFLGRKGPLSRQQLFRITKGAAEDAEIDRIKVSPHTLRHSCATHMVEHGADLVAIKQLLGHSSINTVEIYTRLSTDHLKQVYENTHPLAEDD